MSTGGSGSEESQCFTPSNFCFTPIVPANAIRYGTAKVEWFLTIVRLSHEFTPQARFNRQHTGGGTSKQANHQDSFHDACKPTAELDLTKLFIGTKGTIWIVMKVRCSTFKQLRAKLILVIPVTLRLAPLLKTNVAVAQFLRVRTATMVVKDILNTGVGIRLYD